MRHALCRGLILAIAAMMLAMPLLANEASAHSPLFPQGNTNLESAFSISDPSISWSIYASLGQGFGGYTQANYYKMDMGAGDRLLIQLLCPVEDYQRGFRAEMILIGPGMNHTGTLPPNVQQIPTGYGYHVFASNVPNAATFEGFSPSAFYYLYQYDGNVSLAGTYYVAIANPQEGGVGGNYGFAPGYREEFTIPAIVTMPFSLFQIYQWEGQNFLNIILPGMVVLAIGFFYLLVIKKDKFARMSIMNISVFVGGLWFLGTAAMTAIQFLWAVNLAGLVSEALITLGFIFGQAALGLVILWQSFRVQRPPGAWRRAGIFAMGLLGIVVWAGYIIGPLFVMMGALLPWKKKQGKL